MRDALATDPNPARFGETIVAGSMAFIPVVDGDSLPAHPLAAIATGASAQVPLLIGTNTEEFRLFLVATGDHRHDHAGDLLGVLAATFGGTDEVVAKYQANRPEATAGDVFAALLTDRFFRLPALAVAGGARHRASRHLRVRVRLGQAAARRCPQPGNSLRLRQSGGRRR